MTPSMHFHKCENCGFGVAHKESDPIRDCEEFIKSCSEECARLDEIMKEISA